MIIIIGLISGLLGAAGGSLNKNYRRLLLPLFLTVLAIWQLHSLWCVFTMAMTIAFSIGYGIPSPEDDDPSSLGKFWFIIFKGNIVLSNITTRGTIGFLVCLSLLPISIINHNWLFYGIGSLTIMLSYCFISWRDLGGFYFKGKYLLGCDFIIYGIIGIVSWSLIWM